MKLKKVLALLLMFALLLSAAGCKKGAQDAPEAENGTSVTLDISADMPAYGDKLNTFSVSVLKNGQPVEASLTWFPGDDGKAEDFEPDDVFTPLLGYNFDLKIPLEEGETLENAVINLPETIYSFGLVEGTTDTLRLSIVGEIKHHTMKVDVEIPTFGDKYKDVKFTFLLDGEPIEPTDVLYMSNGMKLDTGDEPLYPGTGHGFDFTFDNMPDGYYFGTSYLAGSVEMESDNDAIWIVCCVTDELEGEAASRTYRLQVNETKCHEMNIDVVPPAYGASLDTAEFTYTLDGKPIEPEKFTWFTPLSETTPDVFYTDQVYCADIDFAFPNDAYVFANDKELESIHVTVCDDLEYLCAVTQNDDDLDSDVVRVRIKNFTGDPVYLDESMAEEFKPSYPNEESSHNSKPNEESSHNSTPNEESSHNSTPSGEESSNSGQNYAIDTMTVMPSIVFASDSAPQCPLSSVQSNPYVWYVTANNKEIDTSVCSIASHSHHSTSGTPLNSSSVFTGCQPFGETIVVTCQAPYYFANDINAFSAGTCVYDTGTDGVCTSVTLIDSHTLQMEFFHVQPHNCWFDENSSHEPTCTEGAKYIMRCTFCHDYYYTVEPESSPALGHNFESCNEWCECTRCGEHHDHYEDPEPGSLIYTPHSEYQCYHTVTCKYCNDTFEEFANCVDGDQNGVCDLCGGEWSTVN